MLGELAVLEANDVSSDPRGGATGKDAGGLSASTIGRLKEAWSDEHTR